MHSRALLILLLCAPLAAAQNPTLPSETPAKYTTVRTGFDHDRREVMIPMRDGVKLHTVILVPKGASRAPMLMTRTPYDANATTTYAQSSHLGAALNGYDNAQDVIIPGGYIRVVQDIRGKYGSEGDYVMNRPLHGPLNPTNVDESTDTYDTIDWLVKNVPESNGNVGEIGISYDGFEPLMGIINSHPALKVAVPMNPMVDGWMGDDWFHNGAFRQQNMPYILEQEATRDNSAKWWTDHADDYDQYMSAGSAGELGKRHGLEQVGFWNKILAHPSYDSWWQQQAMDKILAAHPPTIPVMLVHSLWDAEDIYGALAVYKALSAMPAVNDKLYLVLGPWHHGQGIENGSSLGAIDWDENTSREFQRNILGPFLAHYLKDGAPPMDVAKVNAYESGTNHWTKSTTWPQG
jgi:putative CocE/NonD family hydrolase